jgi:hypothetical protein
MTRRDPDTPIREDQTAHLEVALIEQFIRSAGHDPAKLHDLPEAERAELLKQAAAHAAGKLAEVESRAHLLGEFHSDHH